MSPPPSRTGEARAQPSTASHDDDRVHRHLEELREIVLESITFDQADPGREGRREDEPVPHGVSTRSHTRAWCFRELLTRAADMPAPHMEREAT